MNEMRLANLSDLPVIVELKLAMYAEAGVGHVLATDALQRILIDYQRHYDEGRAQHFVAEADGELVAMAGAFLKDDIPFRYGKVPYYGYLGDMYTPRHEPGYQELTQQLIEKAIGWLRSRKVRLIRALPAETIRPLCLGLGFKPTEDVALKYPDSPG